MSCSICYESVRRSSVRTLLRRCVGLSARHSATSVSGKIFNDSSGSSSANNPRNSTPDSIWTRLLFPQKGRPKSAQKIIMKMRRNTHRRRTRHQQSVREVALRKASSHQLLRCDSTCRSVIVSGGMSCLLLHFDYMYYYRSSFLARSATFPSSCIILATVFGPRRIPYAFRICYRSRVLQQHLIALLVIKYDVGEEWCNFFRLPALPRKEEIGKTSCGVFW